MCLSCFERLATDDNITCEHQSMKNIAHCVNSGCFSSMVQAKLFIVFVSI